MTPIRSGAVVTGAGSGIGAAGAHRLADSHDLLLSHLQADDDLDQVRTACRDRGATTATVTGDLTDPAVIADLGAATTERTGQLQVVVSAAGVYPRIPWADTTVDVFERQLAFVDLQHLAGHAVTTSRPRCPAHSLSSTSSWRDARNVSRARRQAAISSTCSLVSTMSVRWVSMAAASAPSATCNRHGVNRSALRMDAGVNGRHLARTASPIVGSSVLLGRTGPAATAAYRSGSNSTVSNVRP